MINADNIDKAIEGLGQFAHHWCMNVRETCRLQDLVFRCKECEFRRNDGKCILKMFISHHGTKEQLDKNTAMGAWHG